MNTFFRRLTHVCCEKAVSKLFPEKCPRYARLFEREGFGNFCWTSASKVTKVIPMGNRIIGSSLHLQYILFAVLLSYRNTKTATSANRQVSSNTDVIDLTSISGDDSEEETSKENKPVPRYCQPAAASIEDSDSGSDIVVEKKNKKMIEDSDSEEVRPATKSVRVDSPAAAKMYRPQSRRAEQGERRGTKRRSDEGEAHSGDQAPGGEW